VNVHSIIGNLGAGEGHYDDRLDCGIIHDERHDLILYVWSNGKCVVTEGRHPKMVAMAAVYWRTKFSELGFSTA
jgi:TATA-box binding protein (TBP) (component of TFIID and TFIIIB)